MAESICGGDKYQISERGTIWLHVHPTNLPSTIEVEGYTLGLKTEFHVSLVATSEIVRKNSITDPEFKEKVLADFCEFVSMTPIDFAGYRDEFRFMSEGDARTVVAMVDTSGLDAFFKKLNEKYNLHLEYPPTHVTLYTLQPNVGIFMTDSEDKEGLTKIIPVPVKL